MSTPNPAEAGGKITTCHFIIAHPDKPKFLVIRHTESWSPPMLQVPVKGSLMYRPAIINQGMMQKYNLRTTVLRIVAEAPNYALVELELHASSQRPMQAVWVGRDEYARFGRSQGTGDDPILGWLTAAERGTVPALRSPWERRGWYRQAEQWLSDRLVDLGIQATGSVQQYKAGWPTACVLRVATAQGQIFFKATYDKPPGEARLVEALAAQWPDLVPQPLAVDTERDWMVMRDFKIHKENHPSATRYPDFTAALGRFQVESAQQVERWTDMGCTVMNLPFLCGEDERAGRLIAQSGAILRDGPKPLDDGEMDQLGVAIEAARAACARLAEYAIADSLSHLDYRPDNFFLEDGHCRILDWADAAVTHPFMAMCRTLDFFEQHGTGEPLKDDAEPVDEALKSRMRDAYLAPFEGLASAKDLAAAFAEAQAAFPLFWFLYTASQIGIIEAESPQGEILRNLLKVKARLLIERHASPA